MSSDRVHNTDFANGPGDRPGVMNRDYLGSSGLHIRDASMDVSDSDAYEAGALERETSRSPLHPPPGGPNAHPQLYLTPPQNSSNTVQTAGRVHYPPDPYITRGDTSRSDPYTTIPLQDRSSGPGSPSPIHSGTNTPRNKKWTFLPLHHSSTSLEFDGAEKGAAGEKKKRPQQGRTTSWDLLGERAEWEDYNPAKASVENLRFAEGDVGTNPFSKFYYWCLNRSIIFRWALYIVPVLALLWIPGIVQESAAPNAQVWGVPLLWWSIWLTVFWLGFWASSAAFLIFPLFYRNTVGVIIPSMRKYTDIVIAMGRYARLIVWTVAMWISFTPLIINNYQGDQSSDSRENLTVVSSLLFGLLLSTLVLGGEKLIIQLIALQFHRDSYADRIQEQKFNVRCLTTLYINSHDIPGRTDTLRDDQSGKTGRSQMTIVAVRKALKGLREVAQTTTTALGNVASEMAGQSVLQTNSPHNKITAALGSANKSKALARRIFYSFRQPGVDHLDIGDIARFFPDLDTAHAAFNLFDRDGNGDATRDEIETSILGIHRERLSLEASMRDLDGAVSRLDDIFMVIVVVIVILILTAMITSKLTTLVTSAGAFVLGLSWLIGSTMQEILLACIFLFVKHPYDVHDRVNFDGNSYTVAKMQLMSTSFKRMDGTFVWIGHNVLATKVIENVRRSGPISETFSFSVAFDTSFESLQTLRARMLAFCKENSRDFLPIFDVLVDDMPNQASLALKADIRYKSNWQQAALKVQRRNKWICALKLNLADLKIWGPAGAGNPSPGPADPVRYTQIPWNEVNVAAAPKPDSPPPTFQSAISVASQAGGLVDRYEVINDPSQDIWGETQDPGLNSMAPSRVGTPGANTPLTPAPIEPAYGTGAFRQRTQHAPVPGEHLESRSRV